MCEVQRSNTSVIIPLFNKAKTIERAITSVYKQEKSPLEIIVIDDGSTDDSLAVAQELQKKFTEGPPLYVITQENRGPGAARNAGARVARGTRLAFLDSDDEWMPTFLGATEELFRRYPDAKVPAVCVGYIESPSGRDLAPLWRKRGISSGLMQWSSETPLHSALAAIAYLSSWSTVITKEVFHSLGGFFDEERSLYGEDTFLWLQLLLNHPIVISLDPHVIYHREASELTAPSSGPRPIEPFLMFPKRILNTTPRHMEALAVRLLQARGLKTVILRMLFGEIKDAHAVWRNIGGIRLREIPEIIVGLYNGSFPHDLKDRIRHLFSRKRRGVFCDG
jgi:glycosyltransferase involved in cell wall biosynthesis